MVRGVGLIILSLILGSGVSANDAETRNLLINKFEKVLIGLAPQDPSYTSVTLRLADLLAERARFDQMKELEQGCIECNAGIKDRQKALRYYEQALAKTPDEGQGKIVLQIGHLNEMLGQSQKAEQTYLGIIKANKSSALVAESRAALGEMYFKQRRFPQAREQFEAARKSEVQQQGLAAYRIAWCLFNEGKIADASKALKEILSSPKLLTRGSSGGIVSIDKQFQDEVARDFATFTSRLNPNESDVLDLYNLSPETTRLDNVEYLATELERLGARDRAIQVWRFVQEKQTQPLNRLEGNVRLAQLLNESNQHEAAVREFESALALWNQVQCDTRCAEFKSRLRKFVIDWNKISKKSLTPEVLGAYEGYLGVFADDTEMAFWAAQVARELKNWERSLVWFQHFIDQTKPRLTQLKGKEKQDAETNIENALLNQIEVAELSKSVENQIMVYNRYLKDSPKGDKRVEVQYQKAYLIYKQDKHNEAAIALREVALLQTNQSPDIREQAADLALDALAILKDEARLESWSNEFAAKFPKKRAEYLGVARKSVINQAVAKAAGEQADTTAAWTILTRADISTADEKDKILYYKNKILLAEKLAKFSDARNATDSLLKLQGLSEADREFALAKQAWLAELALDFSTAYSANQKMKLTELKPDQKLLRLAMFAELAEQNAIPLYEQYLKSSQDRENARLVAARLVRESGKPVADLAKHDKILREDAGVHAQVTLETYAKTKDAKLLATATQDKQVISTKAGKELVREKFLKDILPLGESVAKLNIDTKNQRTTVNTIKSRAAALEKLEAAAAKAIESGDWISQVVALSLVGKEVERFYNDIVALPLPEGLTPEEESQYLSLLSQQASPYQVKATDIQAKLKEFWTGDGVPKVVEAYSLLSGDMRSLYKGQLETLAGVAPEAQKAVLVGAMTGQGPSAPEKPSLAEVEALRKLVRDNPNSKENLKQLSLLERKMGRTTMASYLEARVQKLEGDQK